MVELIYPCKKVDLSFGRHGLRTVSIQLADLYDDNGNRCCKDMPNWLELQQIYSAIPGEWKSLLKKGLRDEEPKFLKHRLEKVRHISREVYLMLINDFGACYKYFTRWQEAGLLLVDYDTYLGCFKRLYMCTKSVKLRNFQYRLLLNKIVTNHELLNWGLKDNDLCTFCQKEKETCLHLLFYCQYTQEIIHKIAEVCNRTETECDLSVVSFVLNMVVSKPDHVINLICLITKQWLYRTRCGGKKPTVVGWYQVIKNTYEIEFFNAQRVRSKMLKRWSPISSCFEFIHNPETN